MPGPATRPLAVAAIVLAGALVFAVGPAQAAPGDLDPTFGTSGIVTTAVPGIGAQAVALQPDGKTVVAGFTSVIRYEQNGSLDPSFGAGGIVTNSAARFNALVLQPDGEIVAAGSAFDPPVPGVFELDRYLPNGSLDPAFGSGGVVRTPIFSGYQPEIHALALQPDGKIVAAGGDGARFTLARYLPDGSLDLSFGAGGIVTTTAAAGMAQAVALQPDGNILAAGGSALVRYKPNGSLDPSFGTGGIVTTSGIWESNGLVLQPDAKIVVAGASSSSLLGEAFGLARYNPDGSLDSSFGADGQVATDVWAGDASSVALQADGDIVAAGPGSLDSGPNAAPYQFALIRYRANGSLDTGFGRCGRVMTRIGSGNFPGAGADALAIQPDGKMVAAGFSFDGTSYRFALARYLGGSAQGSCDWLTLTVLGDGSGEVFSDPSGLDCKATCAVPFPAGSSVTLTQVVDYASAFSGWGGDCSGSGTCTLTIDRDRSVTATFSALCLVPNVVGMRLRPARAAIGSAHCSVGRVTRRFSSKVTRRRVISQRPTGGELRPLGANVNLVVSKGRRKHR
jgi:uncharacterized delta-60 repeat protein